MSPVSPLPLVHLPKLALFMADSGSGFSAGAPAEKDEILGVLQATLAVPLRLPTPDGRA